MEKVEEEEITKQIAAARESMAEWIEASAGERVSDHAELLAHHYVSALEIADASGEEAIELRADAARSLVMAGDRALRLDAGRAGQSRLDHTRPRVLSEPL